ncbi:MAG: DUF3575 domain-containing protein [Muribaculaceae bacterium]|nr:DUF3575 domain-containing protein [Muribaculaceae bacterium]
MRHLFVILCVVITARCLSARVLTDSVTVRFRVAETEIVDSYMGNGERLDAFGHRLYSLRRKTDLSLVRVSVFGAASPDRVSPARWALRTNLLYDALAVPNIGAELYLGRSFSLQGEWMYAWWSHRAGNFFWRIYGGDIGLRWWFGRLASERPLAGHHVGVYAQTLIWDFELGGRGYMGGVPGGAIWNRANFGAGIEYGYSLPLNRCLNIDFCIGIGYIGGACREYIPQCGYYVWQSTRQLNYIGPTKVEISLVRTF